MVSKHGGQRPDPEALKAGHETAEAPSRPVVTFLVGIAAAMVIVFGLMFGMLKLFSNQANKRQVTVPELEASNRDRLPPEPRLEVYARRDYLAFLAVQDSVLETYGWVHRDSARVRIPIDRAMRLVADEGLPARQGRQFQPGLRLRPPTTAVEPADSVQGGHGGGHR